jgi:hypothetical protein
MPLLRSGRHPFWCLGSLIETERLYDSSCYILPNPEIASPSYGYLTGSAILEKANSGLFGTVLALRVQN